MIIGCADQWSVDEMCRYGVLNGGVDATDAPKRAEIGPLLPAY